MRMVDGFAGLNIFTIQMAGKGGDDTRPPRQTDGGEELYQTREGKPKERAQITSSQTPENTREIESRENINIFATFSFLRLFPLSSFRIQESQNYFQRGAWKQTKRIRPGKERFVY